MTLRRGKVDWKISYYRERDDEYNCQYPHYLSYLINVETRIKEEKDVPGDFALFKRIGKTRKFKEAIARCKKKKFLAELKELRKKVKE